MVKLVFNDECPITETFVIFQTLVFSPHNVEIMCRIPFMNSDLFFLQFTQDSVVVIHVSRIHVIYDVEEQIVRYASANMATNRDANIFIAPSDIDHQQLLHGNQQSRQEQQYYRNQEYHLQKENVTNQRPLCANCAEVFYICLTFFFCKI